MNMGINLNLIIPEITLAGLALLILALDLIFLHAKDKGRLGWLAAGGCVGVIGLLVWHHSAQGEILQSFLVDPFAFIFKLLLLAAAAICCLSAVDFANKQIRYPGEFFALILFSTLGLMLMVSAGDLLLLYLGLELSTISLYALAAMQKDKPKSGEAGLKYLIMGAVSSAVLLYGASLLYGVTGTTVFARMDLTLLDGPLLLIGLVMVLGAFAFKITAVPFHMWAPDVYQGAPTPVTGYLSVASKAAGFAALIRIFMGPLVLLNGQWIILVTLLAALSMIVGNLIAIPQTNIKRMLAYSGIAQAGYILIAIAAANEKGITAAIFFLFQYVFTNLGAFIIVSLVGSAKGNDEISSYAGLSRKNPLLAVCMLVLLLSLGGIPPLSGFWSKVFLFWAGAEQGLYSLVFIGVLATVVSLYYYLMVARQMYIAEPVDDTSVKVGLPAALALALCTIAVLALGYPKPWLDLAQAAARLFNLPGN